MAMVVKNNMTAVNTLNILNKNSSALSKSLQKVSSGMKINSAADDASGYAISERMRVQIRSLDQANQNTQNGSSMMKVAEGAVSSTVEILKTLKEKAVNAANDSNTDSDRQTIQKELDQSIDQINDNANVTFNGKYLVDGSKNTIGKATYTALSNQSLKEGTTGETELTELAARNGDSLEIQKTDKVTVSYVQGGKTHSVVFQVGYTDDAGNEKIHTLQDIFQAAEDADTSSQIFADAGNRSVYKATDPTKSEGEYKTFLDGDYKTAVEKRDAYNEALDDIGSITNATSVAGKTIAAVNAYNAAATVAGTTLINIKASDYSNAGEYLKALSTDAIYTAAATGSTTNFGNSGKKQSDLLADAVNAVATELAAYTAADTAYTAAMKKQTGPNLLTGSNVGLAASDDMVTTASGQDAITITANTAGIGGQISGFNISITDSKGNVKKSANAALDAFEETVRAQNESADNAISLQVGAKANQSIKVGLTDMRAEALGLQGADGTKLNISTQVKANAAINVLDNAIQKALDQQTTIGSVESRLEYTSSNLTTASENVQASESTIRDADMAKEMTEYTKNNVLLQAAQSMLAQANQSSSNVLSLLQ